MTDRIAFVGDEMVHLDPLDSCWVNIKRFTIDPDATDRELLEALLEHPEFHDHYAGQPVAEQTDHSLHGPYRLSAITVDTFVRADAEAAEQLIRAWADDPEPSLAETHDRLRSRVYPALHDSTLYQLPALAEAAHHDWGWVVGAAGFHEFVAINRPLSSLTLLVASDD